ncbi:MAG: hypothetical protein [Podoviridae sp. cty5g4]|nr:MAG: hypothetical protein [Podoviridae sp. cty5g4]
MNYSHIPRTQKQQLSISIFHFIYLPFHYSYPFNCLFHYCDVVKTIVFLIKHVHIIHSII